MYVGKQTTDRNIHLQRAPATAETPKTAESPATAGCQQQQRQHQAVFLNLCGPRNRFQGIDSASLCSLAGRYDNPSHNRFLAPLLVLKFQQRSKMDAKISSGTSNSNIVRVTIISISGMPTSGTQQQQGCHNIMDARNRRYMRSSSRSRDARNGEKLEKEER